MDEATAAEFPAAPRRSCRERRQVESIYDDAKKSLAGDSSNWDSRLVVVFVNGSTSFSTLIFVVAIFSDPLRYSLKTTQKAQAGRC
jgi:hypothetical protein